MSPSAKKRLSPARASVLLARRHLAWFVRSGWKAHFPAIELEWGEHIEALCDHIQWQLEDRAKAVADRSYTMRAQNILVNIPPRSLKTAVLVFATAWAWLRWPTMRILYLSANPRVAQEGARLARDLIAGPWYQSWFAPEWQIRDDQDAISSFGNSVGGSRVSRGLDSTITGEGADWQCIDDPHDVRDSRYQIEQTNAGYRSAVANRINDPRTSIRTAIMQRVAEYDWASERLKDWMHLRIPMLYEVTSNCPCGKCDGVNVYGWKDWRTVEGEVMHERFTPEFLAGERTRLGSYGWAAQMQQRPAPAGGGMFKRLWWRYWRRDGDAERQTRPHGCYDGPSRILPANMEIRVISLDAAFKGTANSDDVALGVIGAHGADRYVLDVQVGKWTFTETIARLRAISSKHPHAYRKLIEDKANGPAIIDALGSEIQGLIPVNPQGGKESRANAAQPAVEAGNVYLMDGADWLDAWVGEFDAFPSGSQDGRVDMFTQAMHDIGPSSEAALLKAAVAGDVWLRAVR